MRGSMQETATIAESNDLLATLVALRRDVIAEGDTLFSRGRDFIQREEYLECARNLACYLALRRRDLRPLQTALMCRGLSSLGRSESRVVPTLDAMMTSLAAMLRVDDVDVPGYPSEASFFYGAETIARQADAILGPGQHGRDTRIMVTLATEAAEDPSLIQALVAHGVESVRINCAHDSQAVWEAMIANVRRAEQATGRPERVRVLNEAVSSGYRTQQPQSSEQLRMANAFLQLKESFGYLILNAQPTQWAGTLQLSLDTLHQALNTTEHRIRTAAPVVDLDFTTF